MKVGFFGGTFDPPHRGHLAVARAAASSFRLDRVLFVPANLPPHKLNQRLTPYVHRYAMIALSVAKEAKFLPSLLEAPQAGHSGYSYSLNTVRLLKRGLRKNDVLYFIIGIDAFLDIAKWHQPEALLRECEFIVVSRPGYSLADVAQALPLSLRTSFSHPRPRAGGSLLRFPGVTIHLLTGVRVPISATQVRNRRVQAAARSGLRELQKLVTPAVAGYIQKLGLYRNSSLGAGGQ